HSFASLADAVEFAKAGDVITLIRDITASDIITIDKAITLDGNGKTLTSTAARAINVNTEGDVTIKNLIVDADNCEEFAIVTNNAGNTRLVDCDIEYKRTFVAQNIWYALYVPFEISIDAEFLENYDVAEFTGLNVYDNSNMSMSVQFVETGYLAANTPYLIRVKNEEALTLSINVDDAEFDAEPKSFVDGTITASFSGTYTETVASEIKGAYAMSGGLFRKAAAPEQILKPFRFYLMLTDSSTSGQALSLRSVAISFDNEQDGTTAIEKTQTSEETIVIYDLTGRRVMEPQEGEIYIINGKKVLF
ncbi:MAG: hypothetical protein J6V02_07505, partial [Bacteroidaceae bacterium]|nr:hypothetical protein [Bacteroidaceae bacterium]